MSLIVIGIDKYVADNCWLTLEHNILYCAFVAPAAMIVLVSILSLRSYFPLSALLLLFCAVY